MTINFTIRDLDFTVHFGMTTTTHVFRGDNEVFYSKPLTLGDHLRINGERIF